MSGRAAPKRAEKVRLGMYIAEDLASAIRETCARTNQSVAALLEPILRENLHRILSAKRPVSLKLRRGRKIGLP